MKAKTTELRGKEEGIRKELRDARERAERDVRNLERLKELFLDCLIRSKLSGFYEKDVVRMEAPYFLPEVMPRGTGDLAVTSFGNLGSGGKKTLFKCCFAVAVHRLAVEIEAVLPTLMIIDSPMKNISERENREQFVGFYDMLYELSETELKETQFVAIDKELHGPPDGYRRSFLERHMVPNAEGEEDGANPWPPLIRYYRGK